MKEITKPIPHNPDWKARPTRGLPCVICGREVSLNPRYEIILVEGGTHMAQPGTENQYDPGFMGLYPVGTNCVKKFKEELRGFLIDNEKQSN